MCLAVFHHTEYFSTQCFVCKKHNNAIILGQYSCSFNVILMVGQGETKHALLPLFIASCSSHMSQEILTRKQNVC